MMTRIAFLLATFFPLSGIACEQPHDGGDVTKIPGATVFGVDHKIREYTLGVTTVTDYLSVWGTDAKDKCFIVEATSNNLHFCHLGGKATKIGRSEYEFQDETCHVRLRLQKGSVNARVAPIKGGVTNWKEPRCWPSDNWGCGTNTPIESRVYKLLRVNG